MWELNFVAVEKSPAGLDCTFEVRSSRDGLKHYRVTQTPSGLVIRRNNEIVKDDARPNDVEALLPSEEDSGFKWTYHDLLVAGSFWREGFDHAQ